MWGETSDGRVLWQLACEATDDPELYWLNVPDRPSTEELLAAVVPIVGRPIAEALIHATASKLER
jgi:hypothetical protein